MKVTPTTKMFKCQEKIIQAIKKVTGKFLITFFLMKIPVMNVSFRSSQQELFYKKKVFCKIMLWSVVFLYLWSKTFKNTLEGAQVSFTVFDHKCRTAIL